MSTEEKKVKLPGYANKYDVHPDFPNHFMHKGVEYFAEKLTNQQIDKLAEDPKFEFLNKKEEEKPSAPDPKKK